MAGTINKPKKPTSKRGTSRLRHKIEKKAAAKQRKQRKLAKNNPEWRSRMKKDPGVLSGFAHRMMESKDGSLETRRIALARQLTKRTQSDTARAGHDAHGSVEHGEQQKDAEAEALSSDADESHHGSDNDMDMDMDGDVDESNPMAALLASARSAAARYNGELERDHAMADDDGDDNDASCCHEAPAFGQSLSRKTYDKVFKQVVEQADVVLYVLDARDPQGTRSREVERSVMAAASGGKRLILIVNKMDLVPPKVLRGWLVHLRRYFPTLPLRAAGAAANATTFNHGELTAQKTAASLFGALKAFAATRQLKRAVSVGVIGYPNVGKSSVINALLGRMSTKGRGAKAKPCPAGAEAGVTTSIRCVKIDSKLTLLDSPGVVFPSSSSLSGNLVALDNALDAHAHLVLLNAVPPKQINDAMPAVSLLIRRLSLSPDLMRKLTEFYDIPPLLPDGGDGDVTTDFLVQVARKRGRLGRGGVPNVNAAAMTVVTDWRDGRIQGWVEPPALPLESGPVAANKGEEEVMADQKEIVTEWAAEFKLEGLWGGKDDEGGSEQGMQESRTG
ncbi:hypothetical protein CDD82_3550 [Ophiocordyceps australis]|uniref:CP-type G domain-containing protein n=1 Tax=Ophiocordyceps australis TaxID=1399860 RepID=A0A2C5ZBF6_9HYPO|nr:hypothetical protein CDD82_3550 [Ophiocordyceps australis]